LALPTGNPVFAAAAGVVRQAECDSAYCDRPGHVGLGGCGNIVDINHGGNVMTRYCHLVSFGPGIRAGAQVQAGQLVGLSGSTGNSSGPHLHFETHVGGRAMNPVTFMNNVGLSI
jgi:murein DD-endopeptidase MepM/ murein hydrolase activator NlpD